MEFGTAENEWGRYLILVKDIKERPYHRRCILY